MADPLVNADEEYANDSQEIDNCEAVEYLEFGSLGGGGSGLSHLF